MRTCVNPAHLLLVAKDDARRMPLVPAVVRFWAKVDKTGPCWLWTGAKNEHGYGDFYVERGVHVLAHRWAWEMQRGEADSLVLHTCDTPACVNVDHLFLGTNRDNTRDMMAKGRARFFGRK